MEQKNRVCISLICQELISRLKFEKYGNKIHDIFNSMGDPFKIFNETPQNHQINDNINEEMEKLKKFKEFKINKKNIQIDKNSDLSIFFDSFKEELEFFPEGNRILLIETINKLRYQNFTV